MAGMLKKSMAIGFIFGIILAISVYFSEYELDYGWLWLIPCFTALLCGLGVIVAIAISSYLISKKGLRSPKPEIIGFISAALLNCIITFVVLAYADSIKLNKNILLTVFWGLLGLGLGAFYGVYMQKINRMKDRMEFLEALAEKNKKLQQAARKIAITEERNRMSRELHDSVSQGLQGLIFMLHSLRNELGNPSPRVAEILHYMQTTANVTLDELRTMIEELKPSLLDEVGLEKALGIVANLFSQRRKIPVELSIELSGNLSSEAEIAIYRITQEALHNIEKHAAAQQVLLRAVSTDKEICLEITDKGKGFDIKAEYPGNGLKNMRKRVEDLGGSFLLSSKLGQGTSINAKFPLSP